MLGSWAFNHVAWFHPAWVQDASVPPGAGALQEPWLPFTQLLLAIEDLEMPSASGCTVTISAQRMENQGDNWESGLGRGKAAANTHRLPCLWRGGVRNASQASSSSGAQPAAAGGGEGPRVSAAAHGERVKYHFKGEAKAQACEYITRRTIYAQARVQFDTGIMKKRRSLWMT